MSELKAFDITVSEEGYCEGIVKYRRAVYDKSEADKVIAGLKAAAKEPIVPNRTCRKCGNVGTLMYLPVVKDVRTYWNLYNNKGIDYVLGIQCAHCGEVAFVTKQVHEYALRHQKYKRCLEMALWCDSEANYWYDSSKVLQCCRYGHYIRWFNKWSKLAEKFKEADDGKD